MGIQDLICMCMCVRGVGGARLEPAIKAALLLNRPANNAWIRPDPLPPNGQRIPVIYKYLDISLIKIFSLLFLFWRRQPLPVHGLLSNGIIAAQTLFFQETYHGLIRGMRANNNKTSRTCPISLSGLSRVCFSVKATIVSGPVIGV